MRIILLLLVFSSIGFEMFGQQQFFIYIQSESQQPFYCRLNEKIYSSNETGYLIIPKLDDNVYSLFLGFPKNQYPEQRFQVAINKKDKGFLLKHDADKGWVLQNLQSPELLANMGMETKNTEITGTKKTDAFSVLLSNVVNDSTILYTQVTPQPSKAITPSKEDVVVHEPVKKEETSTENIATASEEVIKKHDDSLMVNKTSLHESTNASKTKTDTAAKTPIVVRNETEKLPATVAKKAETDRPFISRLNEEKNATVYKATYLEQYNYETDTIVISILLDAPEVAKVKTTPPAHTEPPIEKAVVNNDVALNSSAVSTVKDSIAPKKNALVLTNSDCKSLATDNEIDKLRVRILGEKSVDGKLAIAKKMYRNKCLTVKQVKALTELFTTEELKYRFLDLSYAYTFDSSNYYLLEQTLNEEYYKNRFRAMIHK